MNKILFNALSSDNVPNLLIYPDRGKYLVYKYLNEIYDISDNIIVNCDYISYTRNNIYYEFNINSIINKNIASFSKVLKEIIVSKNYFSELNHKIIIFKNFNCIRAALQNILRVMIEKYRETTVFILCTDKYNSVIEPLRSRHLCLRFPKLNRKEKRQISYENNKFNLLKIESGKRENYYDFIYNINCEENIKLTSSKSEFVTDHTDPCDLTVSKILVIYKEPKLSKAHYISLREISHNIFKFNFDISHFYYRFLCKLLELSEIRDNSKYKIIVSFAQSEYNFRKSYRSIIVIESLLIIMHSYFLKIN